MSAVGAISSLPLDGGSNNPVAAEDTSQRGSDCSHTAVQVGFPRVLCRSGSRLIAGRDMTWAEMYNQKPVALVSENMARELWRDPRAAVGKRIRAGRR